MKNLIMGDCFQAITIHCNSQFYLMENSKIQPKANIYNHHFRQPAHKKSIETSETINDSLPTIPQNKSQEKANVLRNQLNDTKSEIALMQAKLRNLQKVKEKNELRNQQNITKINFMNNVKQRIRNDFEYKQKVRQQKQEELGLLKQQAEFIRQSLVTQRKNAENSLYTIKANEAEEERRRKKQHEYLIRKLKDLDSLENSRKVEKVKEFHEQSSSRLQEFHESRVNFSKDNYLNKVASTLKAKERAKSVLQKLREQQQKIMRDVKASQQVMLTSLYSLQTLNPEKKRKRFNSDKGNKYQIDDYSNQQFQA